MLSPLTKRQKEILDYINSSIIKNGYAPSLIEIKDHFKLKAISTVHEHLENLKNKGYIKKEMNQARGIQLQVNLSDDKTVDVPINYEYKNNKLVQYKETKTLLLDRVLLKKTGCYFAINITQSIEDQLCCAKGDVLICDEKLTSKKGQLCLVENDGNYSLMKDNGLSINTLGVVVVAIHYLV